MTPAAFDAIASLVQARSGIVLTPDKDYMLKARLAPIAKRLGLVGLDDLARRLSGAQSEELKRQVVEALTTNETSFFRDGNLRELRSGGASCEQVAPIRLVPHDRGGGRRSGGLSKPWRKTSPGVRQSCGEVDDGISVRAQAGDRFRPAVRQNAVDDVGSSIEAMPHEPKLERRACFPECIARKGVPPDIDQVDVREIVPAA